jgi:hypothetical protein
MSMSGHDLRADTAENYLAFALEARGRSPHYVRLATEVAEDGAILAFLGTLPKPKRQPNLLFAAACYLLGEPAALYRGDLLTDTAAVARKAPADATLVIYHSAVLAYLAEPQRRQFAELVQMLDAVWLSNEAPGVLPGTVSPDIALPSPSRECFVLVKGGMQAIALTDGHGTWLRWLP